MKDTSPSMSCSAPTPRVSAPERSTLEHFGNVPIDMIVLVHIKLDMVPRGHPDPLVRTALRTQMVILVLLKMPREPPR